MGRANGGFIPVHTEKNNEDMEGSTAIVKTYGKLLKNTKHARIGEII